MNSIVRAFGAFALISAPVFVVSGLAAQDIPDAQPAEPDPQFLQAGDETPWLYEGSNVPYRATYLIDEGGMVFHESMNFMLLTRNTRDFLRFIDMHTRFQKHGEICPANWEL